MKIARFSNKITHRVDEITLLRELFSGFQLTSRRKAENKLLFTGRTKLVWVLGPCLFFFLKDFGPRLCFFGHVFPWTFLVALTAELNWRTEASGILWSDTRIQTDRTYRSKAGGCWPIARKTQASQIRQIKNYPPNSSSCRDFKPISFFTAQTYPTLSLSFFLGLKALAILDG